MPHTHTHTHNNRHVRLLYVSMLLCFVLFLFPWVFPFMHSFALLNAWTYSGLVGSLLPQAEKHGYIVGLSGSIRQTHRVAGWFIQCVIVVWREFDLVGDWEAWGKESQYAACQAIISPTGRKVTPVTQLSSWIQMSAMKTFEEDRV